MDFLFSRPVVVTLAIVGAALSVSASLLRSSGKLNEARARRLNFAGYVVMGASMLLFAVAGLRGLPP